MNAFSKILTLCLTLAICCLSGCENRVTDYYPLKVGNAWTFITTDLTTETTRENVELIIKRDKTTYFFDHGEQFINMNGRVLVNRNGYVFLKTPLEIGAQWKEIGASATIKITNKGKRYIVPAGQFDQTLEVTWWFERVDEKDKTLIYKDITIYRFAKGVGPVYYYYEVIRPDGEKVPVFKSELVKFENVRHK